MLKIHFFTPYVISTTDHLILRHPYTRMLHLQYCILCLLATSFFILGLAASSHATETVQFITVPEVPFALDRQLSCGPRCAHFLLSFFDLEPTYSSVLVRCEVGPNGVSMSTLNNVLVGYGLNVVPVTGVQNLQALKQLPAPAIVHVSKEADWTTEKGNIGHFIVVVNWDNERGEFLTFNPPDQYGYISESVIAGKISGPALVVSDDQLPNAENMVIRQTQFTWYLAATACTLFCLYRMLLNKKSATN